jgi:uncharacterized protein involved in exopolysaccharide biosynthesis
MSEAYPGSHTESMQSEPSYSSSDEIDLLTLGRAVWRSKKLILGLAIGAGVLTFVVLSMVRPLYTSEARILIDNDQSVYRAPSSDQTQATTAPALDEQTVESQVQVLTSLDLAMQVVKRLDLTNNPQFAKDSGIGPLTRLLRHFGIGAHTGKSEQEKAADAFADHLTVYVLNKSNVIAIDYTSGDPELAAKAANTLANAYIDWQRQAKLAETKDATAWLGEQITALRAKVAQSEAAVDQYRTKHGLYAGTNNVNLSSQQLSELNSQLILAKAQKSEAEARARLIMQMLANKGDIDATPEVLQSPLIGRLIEQRVQVQRQLAELSATLLPSHPRIQQLTSELKDVRGQIRDEANKIVQGLQNQAQVASARETSLLASLDAAKSQASGESVAAIRLQELQREAKVDRDLLDSYMARYRDASARHDIGAVPADATIVSNAYAPIKPSFPRRLPITALVMFAVVLLMLAYILARELINGTATSRIQDRPRRELPPFPEIRRAPQPQPGFASPVHDARTPAPDAAAAYDDDEPVLLEDEAAEPVERPHGAAPQPRPEPPALQSAGSASEAVRQNGAHHRPDRHTQGQTPHGTPLGTPVPGAASRPEADLDARLSAEEPARLAANDEAPSNAPSHPHNADIAAENAADARSDLELYLRRRMQQTSGSGLEVSVLAPRSRPTPRPVMKQLDKLCDALRHEIDGQGARAVLIAPVSAVNALPEAITIARDLLREDNTAVLIDIARGTSTVSDFMGLARSPGFTELVADRASFDDVIRIDGETALQVIPAGDPNVPATGNQLASFLRVFDALTQTYDVVVIHADRAQARAYVPALQGLLSAMVALFAPDTFDSEGEGHLAEFAALDCPILLYERGGKARLTGTPSAGRLAMN